jgi:hypothetical protein
VRRGLLLLLLRDEIKIDDGDEKKFIQKRARELN